MNNRLSAAVLCVSLLIIPGLCGAQVFMGTGIGPDSFVRYPADAGQDKPDAQPFALALTQYFSSSTWQAVRVSTSSPAQELTDYMYRGFYRQEIVQLIVMAEKSGRPFGELAKERKNGLLFEEMAGNLKIDFLEVVEKALDIRKTIDEKILPGIPVPSELPPDVDASTGTEKTGDSPSPGEEIK